VGALGYQFAYRRHLPHFQPPGATLFVTFRLAGSSPSEVQEQLRLEVEQTDRILAGIADPDERAGRVYLEQRRLFGRWGAALDTIQNGPFWLCDPRIAGLVAESLRYRDGKVYDLDTFCVMPNHVHLIFTPLSKTDGDHHALAAIMHSLKRHTARQANRLLGREGSFWQHESYDHVVRGEVEQERVVAYVLNNPVKAELADRWEEWEWTYCKQI
jgi:REP element-mobilizing transposase RayT